MKAPLLVALVVFIFAGKGTVNADDTVNVAHLRFSPRAQFGDQTIALENNRNDKQEDQQADSPGFPLRDDWQPHVQYAIRAGEMQANGVNLGGWLMMEAWMAAGSSPLQGVDDEVANSGEQQVFAHTQPRVLAEQRFKSFRDTFITEDEVRKIAIAGFNTVRVPVGYWIVGFDNHDPSDQKQWKNFAPGGLDYLDRLIRDWAKKYNIAVLINMHGAKGSQNGADHSGPEQPGKALWSQYPENVASTLDAVTFLAARYKDEDAFLGIGLMNEPSGDTDRGVLYQYYADAYKAIREDAKNDCILTISPLLWEQSANFMTEVLPLATHVWVEWHRYFVWGYEKTSPSELLGSAMDTFRSDVEAWRQKSDKKIFIGEFSFASADKFNDADSLTEFGLAQLRVLTETVTGGWAFWSWRIAGDERGANGWSLRSLLHHDIYPQLRANQ